MADQRSTSVWSTFVLMALLLMCLPSASARADAYTGAGVVQLKPLAANASGAGKGISTQSVSADGTFYCAVPYAAVQASPSGFVVGNCTQNTEFRRIMKSGLIGVGNGEYDTYEGGCILGAFNGCGWVRSAQTNAYNTTTQWSHCNPNSIGCTVDEFMYRFPSGQYYYDTCNTTDKCDGTLVNNRYPCYTVANVRPWLSGQDVPAAIRVIPQNATHGLLPDGRPAPRLAWRYVTKYPTKDGTYWVMARDRAYTTGQGNWVFVPLSCL